MFIWRQDIFLLQAKWCLLMFLLHLCGSIRALVQTKIIILCHNLVTPFNYFRHWWGRYSTRKRRREFKNTWWVSTGFCMVGCSLQAGYWLVFATLDFCLVILVIFCLWMIFKACDHRLHPCLKSLAENREMEVM